MDVMSNCGLCHAGLKCTCFSLMTTVRLPSIREYLFGFKAHVHCLVHVRMLLYLCVGSRITITQAHTQIMQQTHTHRQWPGMLKLLSRQRQSDYRKYVQDFEKVPELLLRIHKEAREWFKLFPAHCALAQHAKGVECT